MNEELIKCEEEESNPIKYIMWRKWEIVSCKLVFFSEDKTIESGAKSIKELEEFFIENFVHYSKSQIYGNEMNLVRFTANSKRDDEDNNTYPNEIAIIIKNCRDTRALEPQMNVSEIIPHKRD